jgi:hypothetical protein
MKQLLGTLALVSALALTGCGMSQQQADQSNNQQSVPADKLGAWDSAAKAALPKMVVVRVALDKEGKPTGQAETRQLDQASSVSSGSDAQKIFENASAMSELDNESSAESCHRCWYYPRYNTYYYGYGYNYGYGYYNNNYYPYSYYNTYNYYYPTYGYNYGYRYYTYYPSYCGGYYYSCW